ncbi:2Fe-2S iron-sulfur cluster-binding protein [Sandaracinobacteroides hominis]|uniref:2Fe-2S iron-sulfur cluster-binding protein n=1 Tax=Sandaracinobacteroides hominis TaxID=2780086 RepID=UPI0018F4C202|nr:2Fe-2S iron-sulfur cluster-binding protein [Sandaracinobacteroides hominis]
MTNVRFLNPDGTLAAEATAPPGQRLLTLAQTLGLPLEGTCEGAMACSTCHVLVAPTDLSKLPAPSAHEEDMLDFTPHAGPTSRLSCQIELTADLATLEVRLPPNHANMQGR